jgi:hypothetical protein
VFLGESGSMFASIVRRTITTSDKTPILKDWDRRDRISAISAITVSPSPRHLGL